MFGRAAEDVDFFLNTFRGTTLLPRKKYGRPMTSSHSYGWDTRQLVRPPRPAAAASPQPRTLRCAELMPSGWTLRPQCKEIADTRRGGEGKAEQSRRQETGQQRQERRQ